MYIRGRRGKHMRNVDAGYKMQGQISDDVGSIRQQDHVQATLMSRTALPHPEAPRQVLALWKDVILRQCVYGRAFIEGGYLYARTEVPYVLAIARAYRGPWAWVIVHGVSNGGHHFGHPEEAEGSVLCCVAGTFSRGCCRRPLPHRTGGTVAMTER